MNAFAIAAGIGYRLFLIAPFGFLVTVIATAVTAASGQSSKKGSSGSLFDPSTAVAAANAFMYMIPVGQGLGFAGAVGWFVTTRPHPWTYPVLLLLSTQLFMSMVYVIFKAQSELGLYAGMPLTLIASVVVLFLAGDQFYGGQRASKVLVSLAMVFNFGGYLTFVFAGSDKDAILRYSSVGSFLTAYIVAEIGDWKGRRAAKDAQESTETVYLAKPLEGGMSYQQPTYGSVQVISN